MKPTRMALHLFSLFSVARYDTTTKKNNKNCISNPVDENGKRSNYPFQEKRIRKAHFDDLARYGKDQKSKREIERAPLFVNHSYERIPCYFILFYF